MAQGFPKITPVYLKATVAGVITVPGNNAPGQLSLFSFKVTNRNAATRYLQLFNRKTALAGGESSLDDFLIPAGGIVIIGSDYFTFGGHLFSVGLTFGISTGNGTYTAATAADHDTTWSVQ